ncbi:MAG: 50S ribosomal protein L32 [Candidatus Altiarchaeota archaeon]|nr:50S ribosomal protein L32 [Candidatus Altiarchaeota archaeon]
MAVPKKKISKTRSRKRKAQTMRLRVPTMIECSNCGNRVLRHRVCTKCGFYRGRQILEPEELA